MHKGTGQRPRLIPPEAQKGGECRCSDERKRGGAELFRPRALGKGGKEKRVMLALLQVLSKRKTAEADLSLGTGSLERGAG